MPVIFITDFFIFLLLFVVVGFYFYARKQEHLSSPWRDVKKRPLAMSSAVILLFFITIGLLDSMHFHPNIETNKSSQKIYSNEILSILDVFLSDLRLKNEKTYSAPLASYSFSKEVIERDDGRLDLGVPDNRGQAPRLPSLSLSLSLSLSISLCSRF